MTRIRPPAVAGTFYPAAPGELKLLVDRLLRQADDTHPDPGANPVVPAALIVPHAGLRYSGAIAAAAYRRLQPIRERLRRVVLFGPSHRVPVNGMALPDATAFDTPLGAVPLDTDNLARLREVPGCVVSNDPHAGEHSLEVQLPFLQRLLPDFTLTPVAIGSADTGQIAAALRAVWGGPETVVLISSDLSHYHPYEEAQRLDESASRSIMSLAAGKLRSRDACGWRGVNGMLQYAAEERLTPTTLDLLNSGDTAGGRDRVVGYGAWAFAGESVGVTPAPASDDGDRILSLAQTAITRAATGRPLPTVIVGTFPDALQRPGATFVTLTRNGRLRGCLGSLQAYRPLVLDVVERAYATATKDPRFPPVRQEELPHLELEVALLTPPRPLAFRTAQELLAQLQPGADGLIIEDLGKRATFLPKVWPDLPEPPAFLARLLQKAGLGAEHWSPGLRAWAYRTHRLRSHVVARAGS